MGWKIVRDKHDQVFGHKPWQWRESPAPAMALLKKISEEFGELVETMDPGELYDLMDAAWELTGIMDADGKYRRLHQHKVARLGGFRRHLEWCPLSEGEDNE